MRRELTQTDPAIGQSIGYLDWVTDAGWQEYHGLLLQFQRRFGGTGQVEARIEAFNAFNRFLLGNPTTNLSNANFGRILTAGDPRVMQSALKFSF